MHTSPLIELPVWRRNLLRAMYLLMAGGLAVNIWPSVVMHSAEWAIRFGHVGALLAGIGALSLLGLRYPIQMLPLMLFELLWKIIWIVAIGVPLWAGGQMTEAVRASAWEIGLGVVLIPLVLPWRYLYVHYVVKPAECWR
jgi:hypothetical protein